MLKDLFQIKCPCCGKPIEIDTRSGIARALKVEDIKGGKDLDTMLQESKREAERLDAFFHQAKDQHKQQEQRLDKMFGEALEEDLKDPNKKKKPRNPFDLE